MRRAMERLKSEAADPPDPDTGQAPESNAEVLTPRRPLRVPDLSDLPGEQPAEFTLNLDRGDTGEFTKPELEPVTSFREDTSSLLFDGLDEDGDDEPEYTVHTPADLPPPRAKPRRPSPPRPEARPRSDMATGRGMPAEASPTVESDSLRRVLMPTDLMGDATDGGAPSAPPEKPRTEARPSSTASALAGPVRSERRTRKAPGRGMPRERNDTANQMDVPALAEALQPPASSEADVDAMEPTQARIPPPPPRAPAAPAPAQEPTVSVPAADLDGEETQIDVGPSKAAAQAPAARPSPEGKRPKDSGPIAGKPKLAKPEDLGLDGEENYREPILAWVATGIGIMMLSALMLFLGGLAAMLL